MSTLPTIQRRIRELADAEDARFLQRYFKTGPGEYGDGDRFIGIRVPVLRKLAQEFRTLSLPDTIELLRSPIHEERFVALQLLRNAYAKGDAKTQATIFRLYLRHARFINNWDLVDSSAEYIVGPHLMHRDRSALDRLARSTVVWERRIAVLATFHFIRQHEFEDTLRIAEYLLTDRHDLMHKAVGWMLREIGKRNRSVLEKFLRQHAGRMPRTMLRYAIEKLPEAARRQYLRVPRSS